MEAMPPSIPETAPTPQASGEAPSNPNLMPLGSALFDPELKGHQGLAKFKDVDSLAKSYVELDRYRNERSGVKALTDQATPEEVTAYRTAMGIPEKPDGYDLSSAHFPEEIAPSEQQMSLWREVFHKANLTPSQVNAIMQAYALQQSENYKALQEGWDNEHREAHEAFVKKHGALAPQRRLHAEKFLVSRYGQEAVDSLAADWKQSSLGNHPLVMEMALDLARYTGHDQMIMADANGQLMNKDVALSKIAELRQLHRDKKISDQEMNRQFTQYAQIAYAPDNPR